jgi:hypothetical protein
MSTRAPAVRSILAQRRARVAAAAARAGLLEGVRASIGARIPPALLEAAKKSSGLSSTTDVIEHALAKLALEDEFGSVLLARRGRAPRDLDLEL